MLERLFQISFSEVSQDFEVDLGEIQIGGTDRDHSNLDNRDLPDQHPMSAITGLEDALKSIQQDKHYVHTQRVAQDTWVIEHPLDKMPAVSVVDSGGSVVVGEVNYISPSKIEIVFTGAFSGKAYLN